MLLVVGLGNPGEGYQNTRHNIGFEAVDRLVHRFSFAGNGQKFRSQTFTGTIGTTKCLALKPQTFMNKSGLAVAEAMQFYKLDACDILVIYDDLDLPVGKVRVRQGGGTGGHNGLKDITARIGSDYKRLRLGIDHPGDKNRVASYVLKPFAKAEQPVIEATMDAVESYFDLLIKGEDSLFLSRIHEAINLP